MQQINFGSKKIATERPAFVMGIVNATPDSFVSESRGGFERAMELIEQGADVIDLGGESTRPGFTPVSVEDEIGRIIPVLRKIRKHTDIPVSIDTTKLEVYMAAYNEGADVWNHVDNFSESVKNAEFTASSGSGIILMHHTSGTIEDVSDYLEQQVNFCIENGIAKDKIILDPGIGFGKSNEESVDIIKNIDRICDKSYPVLMALSRKRCIGYMTGKETSDRIAGTLAADLFSVEKGVAMVRVHDVLQTIDGLNVMKYLK